MVQSTRLEPCRMPWKAQQEIERRAWQLLWDVLEPREWLASALKIGKDGGVDTNFRKKGWPRGRLLAA